MLDILEYENGGVLWRYNGMDGVSRITDGRATVEYSCLCTAELYLNPSTWRDIVTRVNDWMDARTLAIVTEIPVSDFVKRCMAAKMDANTSEDVEEQRQRRATERLLSLIQCLEDVGFVIEKFDGRYQFRARNQRGMDWFFNVECGRHGHGGGWIPGEGDCLRITANNHKGCERFFYSKSNFGREFDITDAVQGMLAEWVAEEKLV